MVAKAPIDEFDSIMGDACGEIAAQNKLIGDAWSQFYQCMDLAGRNHTKLQLLLSSMILIEHQLHDLGSESTSNAVADMQTYFRRAVS